MKALVIVIILIVMGSGIALAGQRYNPYEKRWETVPDSYITRDPYSGEIKEEEPRLRYNPYEGEWRYTRPDAWLQYNPYEHKWEFPK